MNKGLRQPAFGGEKDKVKVRGGEAVEDFRKLQVWNKAIDLFEGAVKDIEGFPKTEVGRIITNQVLRSISSVSANIAEGFGRRKGKEYGHYLYIARGSANESLDWYEKLRRLGYISEAIFYERERACSEIRAMLTGMINKIF